MTARFSELLPRAIDELEQHWHARRYSALEVRDYCSKLTSRMTTRDQKFVPRIDALLEATDRDPAAIAFDIDELVEHHDEGENYRDTLEGAYNLLDRAATIPKQHARLIKLIVAVVVEARGHAANDSTIASYLGAWLEPSTWAREGIEIPTSTRTSKKR